MGDSTEHRGAVEVVVFMRSRRGVRRLGAISEPRVSQFFGSNPAARSPQGPKRGPWRRGVPRTWQEAIEENSKLADGLRKGVIEEPQAPPSVSHAPSDWSWELTRSR